MSRLPPFKIEFLPQAVKDLKGLSVVERRRIREKIEQYAAAPESLRNNVKALSNSQLLRLRVADWRVLFTLEDGLIVIMLVHAVKHRREAYD
jgi:mRNA interferase RelE/StbE